MKQAIRNWALSVVAAGVVASSFVLVWSYAYHANYPAVSYGPLLGEFRPAVVHAGDTVRLCRDITFNRDVSLYITRSLTMPGNERDTTVEFGSMVVHREKGPVSQCRLVILPRDLSPGMWVMRSWVSYETWPFWRTTDPAPPVYLRVLGDTIQ